jgi:DNA-binding transcriptional MerR regulator
MATDLVTAAVIAEHFGVDPQTVSGWAREGRIPTAIVTPGGHRRFRLADVLEAASTNKAS